MKNHKTLVIGLLASVIGMSAFSHPLNPPPSRKEVVAWMEPDNKSFLCYCTYNQNDLIMNSDSCDSPGQRVVVGQIVTAATLAQWMSKGRIISGWAVELTKRATNDPLNNTLFSEAVWPYYANATSVTGTMSTQGQFGACRFTITQGVARIVDGRLGEYARTALYLSDRYEIDIPEATRSHLIAIHEEVPISDRERIRNEMASKWNGTSNHWIDPVDHTKAKGESMRSALESTLHEHRIRNKYR